MNKKLYRNESDKVIGGVCSGLAEYLDIDITVIRIIFLLLFFFGGSGFLIYVIMWIAVPAKRFYNPNTGYRTYEMPSSSEPPPTERYEPVKERSGGRYWLGVTLVALGLCFLFYELNLVPYWFNLGRLWPVFIILLGIWILTRPKRGYRSYSENESNVNTNTSGTSTAGSTGNPGSANAPDTPWQQDTGASTNPGTDPINPDPNSNIPKND